MEFALSFLVGLFHPLQHAGFSPAHPQVGFELATGRLTAQRLSSRNQTADGRLKSRKSEERTHAGSMITPQFMTFSIRYQVRLAQVKGFTQHAGRNGATHVSVHGNSA